METVGGNSWSSGPVATISVGASPFAWTNTESVPVQLMISGGTVTVIEYAPYSGATFMTLGLLGGAFRLNPGDQARVTYILAPTMKYTPV